MDSDGKTEYNKSDLLNRLVFHSKFENTVSDLNKLKIKFPIPVNTEMDLRSYVFPPNGELVTNIEEVKPNNLDAKKGEELANEKITLCAYDESVNNYSTLEGEAYMTSHSLVLLSKADYIPLNLITLYFYTRAKNLTDKSATIKYSDQPSAASKKDYFKDKIDFLIKHVPENSVLFIDGPLIGGDYYIEMIAAIDRFLDKKIIPIFFVKNSESNLVSNNMANLKFNYNSDMHWAFRFLKNGQRTNFFKYVDKKNKKNAKIFCYLKVLDVSPVRIEFHVKTYNKHKGFINSILDLVYYMLLAQGNRNNNQVRPIAIAEKYARESLKLINMEQLVRESGLIPTMNEGRGFAW